MILTKTAATAAALSEMQRRLTGVGLDLGFVDSNYLSKNLAFWSY